MIEDGNECCITNGLFDQAKTEAYMGDLGVGVLDSTGLQQHLPMVLSGEGGEGGWNHQQIGPGTDEMSVELRKANVVADG